MPSFETDLADALDRTTDRLDPDLTALVGGAVKRGRSRRNRRNFGAGVGACAAIAVAALIVPDLLHRGDGELETVALAMPRSSVSGTQMIQALEKTYPGARLSDKDGQSNNPADPSAGKVANGGLIVDDGHGPARVGASAMRLKLPFADAEGLSCEDTFGNPDHGDTCELKELPSSPTLPGGALLMSEKIADRNPADGETAYRWTTTLTVKSTGAQIQLVQWNAADTSATAPKPTRPAPPLTPQQAASALTGPAWAPILGAVG
ncbi:hypothetical protein GCM10010329_19460 [Streptomyces spiroverticillatus]|uniref:Uncharacterized protein n=1 Tax=Streptomyces finlayi TaxID=67296 RepID=A0A918WU82_9ACTN|nr:hypothetical protein [Streptomyces finlayi]GGZ98156.1 hypothetical protein GCM10010329_19460 [Streptomyces spiroverticillatus]GHC83126.1 hypothetical protein GCM10010334_11940 [Streptomyces finlayi]